MTAYVLTCDEANVIPASSSSVGVVGTGCSVPYYAPAPSLLPALGVGQGALIGVAIVAVWALGWGWRVLRLRGL